jgi:hypothetical protein
LIPPLAFVADTQSWARILASAVDPEATPVNEPRTPTTIGALWADADDVDVPGVLELEDDELLLHPARASATTVSAGRTAPVHVRRDRDIIPTLRAGFNKSDYGSDNYVTVRNGT